MKKKYRKKSVSLRELKTLLSSPDNDGFYVVESFSQVDAILNRVAAFLEERE